MHPKPADSGRRVTSWQKKESTSIFLNWETREQGPYRLASNRAMKMASVLKPATSITLESICILLLKATFMASEALMASK